MEQTEVKNYESAVSIIFQLGFKLASEISLRRQALNMGGDTFIYLDKVDGKNGYFAKIESTVDTNESVVEAKNDLKKTFETLGETNFIDTAYFEM